MELEKTLVSIHLSIVALQYAPVAQLDRVPGFEPGGREFESLRARHLALHLHLKRVEAQVDLDKSQISFRDTSALSVLLTVQMDFAPFRSCSADL